MGLMDWFTGRHSSAAPDGFSFALDHPAAGEHVAISQLLRQVDQAVAATEWYQLDLAKLETFTQFTKLERSAQARLIGAMAQRLMHIDKAMRGLEKRPRAESIFCPERQLWRSRQGLLVEALTALMRKKLPLEEGDLNTLLEWCTVPEANAWNRPLVVAVNGAENYAAHAPFSNSTQELLQRLLEILQKPDHDRKDLRKAAEKISTWLFGRSEKLPIEAGEVWSDAVFAYFQERPEVQPAWLALLRHCAQATSANPSTKWLKAVEPLLAELKGDEFKRGMLAWLPLVDRPRTGPSASLSYLAAGMLNMTEPHMDVVRGLIWCCGRSADRELARALTALATSIYRRVPRVGNACVTALGMMPGQDSLGQLALLKVKVKFGTAQIALEKALNAAAQREGLPREELEEMSVPAYGLTEVGKLSEPMGEFTAELTITCSKTAEIAWRRSNGKMQKSLPATVKKEFAEQIKELGATKKDIEKMLPAQAERIDSLFLQQKHWNLETWLQRYLEHPLVGTIARRLIWNFTTLGVSTPGLWLGGKIVDRLGKPVPLDAAETVVSLWHPLDQRPEIVLGWRAFLEEWEVSQPFKQAHREVYLLTPAEERTNTYSNRFASHILKQHQFNALCAARGWKNKLRLMVDDEYPPASRLLQQWGLRAEFWIEGAGSEYGSDTNEAGTYLYLSTDQVRFYPIDAGQVTAHASGGGYGGRTWHGPVLPEPLPLSAIPSLVFSEIMRDVDLFVGVASVGNDPAWADGGRRENERGAWNHFSFGELSATAETRRDLLQKLVPKLKIAERCSFLDRFLVVRGDLRTYKIHLGSGNILMSPNDQYLCIVPGSGGKGEDGKVFLPFEGDRTLSVVLSKAFLLAADAKITDPSITRQIRV